MSSSTETTAARRARYDRDTRATINRAAIGLVTKITIPENVERREFSGPCGWCGVRGECRHRQSYFPESFAESATA